MFNALKSKYSFNPELLGFITNTWYNTMSSKMTAHTFEGLASDIIVTFIVMYKVLVFHTVFSKDSRCTVIVRVRKKTANLRIYYTRLHLITIFYHFPHAPE